jgi:3D (Asp-Asp-Asp) domain-containing protein
MKQQRFDILYLFCLFLAFMGGYSCHGDNFIIVDGKSVSEALNSPIKVEVEKEVECNVSDNKKIVTHVTLTTYNAVKEQTNEDNLTTANGTKLIPHKIKNGSQKICAISRDLLWLIPFNSEIHIEGHGTYIVADLMNKRFTHSIDILQDINEPNFKKEKVKVTLIRRGDLA